VPDSACFLDIIVTPGSTKLAAVDVFVDYDAAVLTATAVAAADNFGNCLINPFPDTDTISCSLLSVNPGLSGTVATISFEVIGATGSTSSLRISAFSCVDESLIFIDCTTVDGLVTIGQVVPSPTASPTPDRPETTVTVLTEGPNFVTVVNDFDGETPLAFPSTGGSPGAALPLLGVLALLAVGTAFATAAYLVVRAPR
jgi:hypothetical protein